MQYGFNLTEANLYQENKPNWKIRYNANEFFEIENLYDYEGIKKMLDNLDKRNDKYDQYLSNFYTEGPNYYKNRNNKSILIIIIIKYIKLFINNRIKNAIFM
jgi:hypothetical protein